MLLRLFAVLTLIVGTGCSSATLRIKDLDRALLDLQSIVTKSLPLGLRKTSPNGREFYSHYFIAKDRKFKNAEKLPSRKYAHILVLGDRRPYILEILVHSERAAEGRGASGYEDDGLDSELAKVVKKRLVQQLNKRREELNIIDDFRVF